MRFIKVKWNEDKKIKKITRLLKLEHDFSGNFTSAVVGNGYKTSNKYGEIIFCFPEIPQRGN